MDVRVSIAPDPISSESLRRLHPRVIAQPRRVKDLLAALHREGGSLWRATNRFSERESARIVALDEASLLLRTENFDGTERPQVFLNFELEGRPYFFASPKLEQGRGDELRVAMPAVIYQAERRDRARRTVAPGHPEAVRVALLGGDGARCEGQVVDVSPDGLGLEVARGSAMAAGSRVRVEFVDGTRPGRTAFAEVRSAITRREPPGWVRLGLSVSEHEWNGSLEVERRETILPGGSPQAANPSATPRAARRAPRPDAGARPRAAGARPVASEPEVIRYENGCGEHLCAIVDGWGEARGAPAVLIPSAWGRTKETLLPLAATIVATFRAAGQPVTVVRFDGIGRRGESYRAPECQAPGSENLRFTFSQGVRDIHATLDFLERSPRFRPSTSVLVTFSVASIEGRRAMATDGRGRLGGWISVVGSADAQSLTRVISGGVDYFGGIERGIRFGLQEIQGLLVDMDHAGRDAMEQRLAFLDDARRDFSRIRAPITWIHGRHDAWMDLERIRHVLAFGDASNRRLVEIPTGHQLRTSQEAFEAFQLIASEVARMAVGHPLSPRLPDLGDLERRRRLETERLSRSDVDLRRFWRDYLVGRDGSVGMELVTHTDPYRSLMELQIESLALRPGHQVLDLGSGVGSFPTQLARRADRPHGIRVTEVDYVLDGLARARDRLAGLSARDRDSGLEVRYVGVNLELRPPTLHLPLRSASFDSAIASLVLNYVSEPHRLLREAFRLVRPGGHLVLSSLKRDADISTICVDTITELRSGRGREALGAEGERRMGASLQHFINDAARLLELEERGLFHFWDSDELAGMVEAAGFRNVRVQPAFGRPAQAFVATARRP